MWNFLALCFIYHRMRFWLHFPENKHIFAWHENWFVRQKKQKALLHSGSNVYFCFMFFIFFPVNTSHVIHTNLRKSTLTLVSIYSPSTCPTVDDLCCYELNKDIQNYIQCVCVCVCMKYTQTYLLNVKSCFAHPPNWIKWRNSTILIIKFREFYTTYTVL